MSDARTYTGGDLTIRMPSKAAISRYATQNGPGTFDEPVSVDSPTGRPMQGWVRCTPGTAGQWDCQDLGFDGDAETYVAEGVAGILEARHPRQALTTVGELLEARRARVASYGTETKALDSSSWVRRVGYDKDTRTMMVDLHGTTYGYRVDASTFNLVANSYSPGSAFNRAVKGQATKVPISNCTLCGRFTSAANTHTCPARAQERTGGSRNTAAWERAAELAWHATANVVAFERRPDTSGGRGGGLLVSQSGDPRRVGVAEWMQREVLKASINDLRESLSQPSMLGPNVTRGFTAAIASDVEPFCDELHAEHTYTGYLLNGDKGKVEFAGLDAAAAKTLYEQLPAENLQAQTTEGAPTVGNLLAVAARNRGTVELVGSVYPPSVPEERVDVAGVLLYTTADDPLEAQRQARLLGVKAGRGPSNILQVDSPWRDGRKAWMLRW